MTGMPTPQMLAIAVGAFEVIAGLMIALNFGARFFAILLIFFVAAATFYFHDFWNQPAPDNAKTLMDALKNLSIIGALFMIAGYGRVAANGRNPPMTMSKRACPPPRRDADIMGGVEHLRLARPQAVGGQDFLRRPCGYAGEAWLAVGQPHPWRL